MVYHSCSSLLLLSSAIINNAVSTCETSTWNKNQGLEIIAYTWKGAPCLPSPCLCFPRKLSFWTTCLLFCLFSLYIVLFQSVFPKSVCFYLIVFNFLKRYHAVFNLLGITLFYIILLRFFHIIMLHGSYFDCFIIFHVWISPILFALPVIGIWLFLGCLLLWMMLW